jgi:phospholipase/carboxylesterase
MTLDALVVQRPPARARQLIALCHGLGADERDLLPVAERLAAEYPDALIVSLRAPQPSEFGFGYQWISPSELDDERRVTRVSEVLPLLESAVRQWQEEAGLGAEATVLLGFSQGAMMVLELAGRTGVEPVAGRVVALAGRYAQLPAAAPAATTVFLMHGKADSVVHYRHTIAAAEHLLQLGGDVVADVIPFLGHEIDDELLELIVRRLKTHVPKRVWEEAMRDVPPGGGTQ